MQIVKIEVNWYKEWANSPNLVVHVDEEMDHKAFIYDAVPDQDAREKTMLLSTNLDPWVKFVYIANPKGTATSDGALGGDYRMSDGSVFHSNTGWSSREGVINSRFSHFIRDDIVGITVKTPRYQSGGWAGFNLYADYLVSHKLWPENIHLVKENPTWAPSEVYWIPSIDPDKVVKEA